jgi:hypothetical protein
VALNADHLSAHLEELVGQEAGDLPKVFVAFVLQALAQ